MKANPHAHADEAPVPRKAPSVAEQLEGLSLFSTPPEPTGTAILAKAQADLAALTGVERAAVGMMTAELHASTRWIDQAFQAVLFCAFRLSQPDFTSDDVWAVLERSGRDEIETERNPSALGAVMVRAKRCGFIVKTGEVRASARPSQHNQEIRVWRRASQSEWLDCQHAPTKEPLHE